ncbi:MAG: (4Fe-4S)-binding protein [Flavobacteriales bacterium]|nr:(4Fe-4S)-binding protein [Flavobacteriales bacterium]MBK7941624.1 (4Fe-4S)-binding protein [Flavobacteriales bacterium]MBK8949352.1 (4Fe-4S)-binding protein [Flavobacteriales bacterium]MBK9700167.1 (4Fe-4S)-binding protein [Flavobacteriales bacterium]
MSDKEHTYTNGEVTIVWKPALCTHSRRCWTGLPDVFKPGERPWIRPGGADTARIVAQVRNCPSGALTLREPTTEVAPDEPSIRIELSPDGPLLVQGPVTVTLPDGRTEHRTGRCALCRCGHSTNKPWCDGSHRTHGFRS